MSIIIIDKVEYDLKQMKTKQLLNLKNSLYAIRGRYHCECCGERIDNIYNDDYIQEIYPGFSDYLEFIKNYKSNLALIKNELSIREHIPNKKEAKEIRRKKALKSF